MLYHHHVYHNLYHHHDISSLHGLSVFATSSNHLFGSSFFRWKKNNRRISLRFTSCQVWCIKTNETWGSMDWFKFKGKSTGNNGFYHQIWGFPVNFPIIQFYEYHNETWGLIFFTTKVACTSQEWTSASSPQWKHHMNCEDVQSSG